MRTLAVLTLALLCTLCTPVAAETYRNLEVTPEEQSSTYRRSKFRHWIDEDQDGENTHKEVLAEESRAASVLWFGPYAGFATGNARQLDVDHLVPLKEAWVSGAHAWTPE